MLEFKYDTQLLIEGKSLDEDVINDYFTNNFKGDCLLAVGDEDLIKILYIFFMQALALKPSCLSVHILNYNIIDFSQR